MTPLRIGIIGDFNPGNPTHLATNTAIQHSARACFVEAEVEWLPTDTEHDIGRFHGLWCSPGSPYRSLDGALHAVRWARLNRTPFLGTCGGFQHAALEFARNVMHISDAQHAEYDPYASVLFVRPLSCSLVGMVLPIELKPGTLAASLYPQSRIEENYYCNFGLNPDYHAAMEAAGMEISGWDDQGEARIVELADHPFFLGTLFVPQTKSSPESPHPVVNGFVHSALTAHQSRLQSSVISD